MENKAASTPYLLVYKKQGRSRVSNGKAMLDKIDGRSREARRYRDICADLTRELGREPNVVELSRPETREDPTQVFVKACRR